MEFILRYLELGVNDRLDQESFDRIKRTFTDRTIVVRRNQANIIYEVEKKVQKMLDEELREDPGEAPVPPFFARRLIRLSTRRCFLNFSRHFPDDGRGLLERDLPALQCRKPSIQRVQA